MTGIAKKMIKRGLKAMINPVNGNIVINHKGKVFEITRGAYYSLP